MSLSFVLPKILKRHRDSGRSRLPSQFILIGRSGGWMDISLGMSTLLLIYGFMKAVDRSIEEER